MDAVLPGERPAVRERILKVAPGGTITAGWTGRKRASIGIGIHGFSGRAFGVLAGLPGI